MEALKKRMRSMPLRKAFCLYVCVTFLCVGLLSALVIWLCFFIQNHLLPEPGEAVLTIWEKFDDGIGNQHAFSVRLGEAPTELPFLRGDGTETKTIQDAQYAVTVAERNEASLSPKRRLLYQASEFAMIAGPVCLSFGGILLCGVLFYKKRLKRPIDMLEGAAGRIAVQDLDFEICPLGGDELGKLCVSFEQMRQALRENHRQLWAALEERKQMQASVAHDLRNPIAIIEGHAEYLQIHLEKGTLKPEKLSAIIGNIHQAARRLERYTEAMRALGRSEELEVRRKKVFFGELYQDLTADLSVITAGRGVALVCKNEVGEEPLRLDAEVLYRILENLIGNAARFAKSEIRLCFFRCAKGLEATVEDDGDGFSQEVLKTQKSYFLPESGDEEHAGLGLAICRIFCEKHGGGLRLCNGENKGACVRFFLEA